MAPLTVAEYAKECKFPKYEIVKMSAQSTEDQFYEGIGRRVEVTNTSFSVDPYLESLERRGGSVECNVPLPLELPLCQEFIFWETNMHDIYMHGTIIPINMVLQSLGSKLVFVHEAALAGRPKNPDSQQQSTNLTPDFILARQHDSRPESICDKGNQLMAVELKHRIMVAKAKQVPGIAVLSLAHLARQPSTARSMEFRL